MRVATGPRGADPHHLRKVLPSTLKRYRDALRPFVAYLVENRFSPSEPAEWDDLLMEFKFEHTPRRAAFEALVAALEFANPHVKGGLPWCRATLTGWSVADPIHHTVPLLRAPCRLLACYMASAGKPRAAGGMIVQRELGLRPGEVTSLFPDDVTLPEHMAGGGQACRAIVALGTRRSTKAKRIQSVVVRNPIVIGVLRWLVRTCKPKSTLMGCSYDSYRKLIRSVQAQACLEAGFTPHSPRAGFATESIAEGQDFVSVREGGRWLSDSSLRVYLDLVGAAALSQQHKVEGREFELVYAATNFLDFLPGAHACQRAEDHYGATPDPFVKFEAGPPQGPGRAMVPRVGRSEWTDSSRLPIETSCAHGNTSAESDDSADDIPRVSFEPAERQGAGESSDRLDKRGHGRGASSSSVSQGRGRGRSKTATSRA